LTGPVIPDLIRYPFLLLVLRAKSKVDPGVRREDMCVGRTRHTRLDRTRHTGLDRTRHTGLDPVSIFALSVKGEEQGRSRRSPGRRVCGSRRSLGRQLFCYYLSQVPVLGEYPACNHSNLYRCIINSMDKNTATMSIEKPLARLLSQYPEIRLAILFGSQATGKATTDSDIDLAVLADTPLNTATRFKLIEEIGLEFGSPR